MTVRCCISETLIETVDAPGSAASVQLTISAQDIRLDGQDVAHRSGAMTCGGCHQLESHL